MAKPSDYNHIRAWGEFLGSNENFIIEVQEKAALEGAPINAIFQSSGQHNFVWRTVDEIEDSNLRIRIRQAASKLADKVEQKPTYIVGAFLVIVRDSGTNDQDVNTPDNIYTMMCEKMVTVERALTRSFQVRWPEVTVQAVDYSDKVQDMEALGQKVE